MRIESNTLIFINVYQRDGVNIETLMLDVIRRSRVQNRCTHEPPARRISWIMKIRALS